MQYIESITAPSLLQQGLLNWKLTSEIVVSYSCVVDCALNDPVCGDHRDVFRLRLEILK